MKPFVISLLLFLTVAVSAQDAYVSVRRANLRDMPSTEGKIVTKLQRNEPLELIEQVGVWWNVRSKSYVGWLHRSTFEFYMNAAQSIPKAWPSRSEILDIQMKQKIDAGLLQIGVTGVTVVVKNGEAILTGTIPKDRHAEVIRVAMEADVKKVNNKLLLK